MLFFFVVLDDVQTLLFQVWLGGVPQSLAMLALAANLLTFGLC